MGPLYAAELLRSNGNNRPMNANRVRAYADAMRAGQWDEGNPDGCTVAIDTAGQIANGQHRLAAIVESGVSLNWRVDYNVTTAARLTMDQGRVRSPGDIVATMGVTHNVSRFAASLRIAWCIEIGARRAMRPKDIADAHEWYAPHVEASLAGLGGKTHSVFVGAVAWVLAAGVPEGIESDARSLAQLMMQVKSGCGIAIGAPSAKVRELLSKRSLLATTHESWDTTRKLMTCIESHLAGRTMGRAYARDIEETKSALVKLAMASRR